GADGALGLGIGAQTGVEPAIGLDDGFAGEPQPRNVAAEGCDADHDPPQKGVMGLAKSRTRHLTPTLSAPVGRRGRAPRSGRVRWGEMKTGKSTTTPPPPGRC